MYMSTQNKKARPAQCTSKSSSALDLQSENNACHTRISISLLEACFETALLRCSGEEWWKCSQTLSTDAQLHLPPSPTFCHPSFQLHPLTGEGDGWVGNGLWTCRQPENKREVGAKIQPTLPHSLSHTFTLGQERTGIRRRAPVMVGLFVDAAI